MFGCQESEKKRINQQDKGQENEKKDRKSKSSTFLCFLCLIILKDGKESC